MSGSSKSHRACNDTCRAAGRHGASTAHRSPLDPAASPRYQSPRCIGVGPSTSIAHFPSRRVCGADRAKNDDRDDGRRSNPPQPIGSSSIPFGAAPMMRRYVQPVRTARLIRLLLQLPASSSSSNSSSSSKRDVSCPFPKLSDCLCFSQRWEDSQRTPGRAISPNRSCPFVSCCPFSRSPSRRPSPNGSAASDESRRVRRCRRRDRPPIRRSRDDAFFIIAHVHGGRHFIFCRRHIPPERRFLLGDTN